MSSRKPRLNLTLDDELKEVISRLSRLMGKPQSTLVNEFLCQMYPALLDLANALEDIENKKSALPHLAKMSAMANQQVCVLNTEMAGLMSEVSKVKEND